MWSKIWNWLNSGSGEATESEIKQVMETIEEPMVWTPTVEPGEIDILMKQANKSKSDEMGDVQGFWQKVKEAEIALENKEGQ